LKKTVLIPLILEKTVMDKNESQVEQSGCGCDSTSGDDVCCSPGGKKNWRTALFVTFVVLAGAVAAHSVLTNGAKKSPCGAGGICAIEEGNGGACEKASVCAVDKGNGGAEKAACCPLEKGNGNGDACPKTAACPIEAAAGDGCAKKAACPKEGNGNGESGCCPSEKPTCPKQAPAGCCPSEAPADPAPQPTPEAPTGCCPGH
jgi:hypothetical protein